MTGSKQTVGSAVFVHNRARQRGEKVCGRVFILSFCRQNRDRVRNLTGIPEPPNDCYWPLTIF